jgi:hypothetical protein
MHCCRVLSLLALSTCCTAQSSLFSATAALSTYYLLEDVYPHVPERVRVDIASLNLEFEEPVYVQTINGNMHTTAAVAMRKGSISSLGTIMSSNPDTDVVAAAAIPVHLLGTQAGLLNTSAARLRCQMEAVRGSTPSSRYVEYGLLGYADVLLLAPVLTSRFGLKKTGRDSPTTLQLTFVRMCGDASTGVDDLCNMSPDWPRGCTIVINGDGFSGSDDIPGDAATRDSLLGFDLKPFPATEASLSYVSITDANRIPLIVIPGLRQPVSSAFQHLVHTTWYPHAHPDDIRTGDVTAPDMFLETASGRMARAVKRTQRHEFLRPQPQASQMLETGAGGTSGMHDAMASMLQANDRGKSANFRADRSHEALHAHKTPKNSAMSRLEELERQAEADTNAQLAMETGYLFAPMSPTAVSEGTELLEMEYSHMSSRFEHEHDEYASLWPPLADAYPHQHSRVANKLDAALLELQVEGSQEGNGNAFLEASDTAAAQAAMQAVISVKTYLNAHIPGLKQILDPIVGNIMKPVTEQVTSSAQSQTVDAAGTEIPQGLKGQVPLDAAACLNDALTYNLTNLLTDAITSMTTTKLCKTLTEKLTPAIVESIMDTALASIHDSVVAPPSLNEAEPLDLAQKLSKQVCFYQHLCCRHVISIVRVTAVVSLLAHGTASFLSEISSSVVHKNAYRNTCACINCVDGCYGVCGVHGGGSSGWKACEGPAGDK